MTDIEKNKTGVDEVRPTQLDFSNLKFYFIVATMSNVFLIAALVAAIILIPAAITEQQTMVSEKITPTKSTEVTQAAKDDSRALSTIEDILQTIQSMNLFPPAVVKVEKTQDSENKFIVNLALVQTVHNGNKDADVVIKDK